MSDNLEVEHNVLPDVNVTEESVTVEVPDEPAVEPIEKPAYNVDSDIMARVDSMFNINGVSDLSADETEQKAKQAGWAPLDDFVKKGKDPRNHVSAKHWLERGQVFNRMRTIADENSKLRQQTELHSKELATVRAATQTALRRANEHALEKAREELRNAVEDNNPKLAESAGAKAAGLVNEIAAMDKRETEERMVRIAGQPPPVSPAPPPYVQAFEKEFPQINSDPAFSNHAMTLMKRISSEFAADKERFPLGHSPQDAFNELARRLRRPETPAPPPVANGTPTSKGTRQVVLTAELKGIYDMFVGQGVKGDVLIADWKRQGLIK